VNSCCPIEFNSGGGEKPELELGINLPRKDAKGSQGKGKLSREGTDGRRKKITGHAHSFQSYECLRNAKKRVNQRRDQPRV